MILGNRVRHQVCFWAVFAASIGIACDVSVDSVDLILGGADVDPTGSNALVVTYVSEANFSGQDGFTFSTNAPIDEAKLISAWAIQGEPVTITLSESALDGQSPTFEVVEPPLHGRLDIIQNAGNATPDSKRRIGRVKVNVYPKIRFSIDIASGPAPLTVLATASTVNGKPLPDGTYTWTFGNETDSGPVETHALRSHVFNNPGTYAITLSVTLAGLSGSISCVNSDTGTKAAKVTVTDPCSSGVSTADEDGDGTPDCNDGCPGDSNKVAPGACGCGTPDTDSDGDGTPDCNDECPNDPNKVAPGACGCGTPDADSDGDGTPDCIDGCDDDSNKVAPGACGCGTPDTDSDGDGTPDCNDVRNGCTASSTTWQSFPIAPQGGTFTVEFDAIPNGANIDAVTGLSAGQGATFADFAVLVRFNTSGKIDARNGGGYAADTPVSYAAGESYHFRVVINVSAHTYTIYVTPQGAAEQTIATDFAFRSEQSGVAGLDHWGLWGGVGSHQVCNFALLTCQVDSDGDGVLDCNDGCPNDNNKAVPGVCGCGVSDVDSDGNGTPDCNDGSPSSTGSCALSEDFSGLASGDDPPSWLDTGANNSMVENGGLFKVFELNGNPVFGTTSTAINIHAHDTGDDLGQCSSYRFTGRMMLAQSNAGIGITFFSDYPNSDSYYRLRCSPGTAFHISPHPGDVQITAGTTDTGVTPQAGAWYRFSIEVEDTGSRTDIRAKVWMDGNAEPANWQIDSYDDHANRHRSGTIGLWSMSAGGGDYWDDLSVEPLDCDEDLDGDGVLNCDDGCPNDANKTSPGICGCGVADSTDSDGDGVLDCVDQCPGGPDTDSDGDGVADCIDQCPGAPDVDSDGDGVLDCNDGCPNDNNKAAPGVCGCGVSDVNSDGDGTPDCNDGCPNDANKTAPGICGCGVPEGSDSDGDGVLDCVDQCPGVDDSNVQTWYRDADGDGCGDPNNTTQACSQPSGYVSNSNDLCPSDPDKCASIGQCGCGQSEEDLNGNGIPDGCEVQTANSITRDEITWTFDQAYQVGQFVNGDWWVVGPVTIASITKPHSTLGLDGSMVNPMPTDQHGYHSPLNGYVAAVDVSRSLPLSLPPGSSIISTISWVGGEPGAPAVNASTGSTRPGLRSAAVLTILGSVPPAGSFRPPYCGNAKPIHSSASLRPQILPSLAPVPSTPNIAVAEANLEHVFLDHKMLWTGSYLHQSNGLPHYGRNLSARINDASLMLMLDEAQIGSKDTLIIRVVQLGIDLHAIAVNGGYHGDDGGGIGPGRKWPILLAGLLLGDADMQGIGTTLPTEAFQEDCQTYYTSGATPTWGERHCSRPWTDPGKTSYQWCCTANSWGGAVLSARILGARAMWNHDPLFDYQDWYMVHTAQVYGIGASQRSWTNFAEEMWDTYRQSHP